MLNRCGVAGAHPINRCTVIQGPSPLSVPKDTRDGVVPSTEDVELGVVSSGPLGGVRIRSSGVRGLPSAASRATTGVLGGSSTVWSSVGMLAMLNCQKDRNRDNDESKPVPKARVGLLTGVRASVPGSSGDVGGASSSERVGNSVVASTGSTLSGDCGLGGAVRGADGAPSQGLTGTTPVDA